LRTSAAFDELFAAIVQVMATCQEIEAHYPPDQRTR